MEPLDNNQVPWYKKTNSWATKSLWLLASIALIMDGLANSHGLVTPQITVMGTIVIALTMAWWVWLQKRALVYHRPGIYYPINAILCLGLLWYPRLVPDPSEKAMQAVLDRLSESVILDIGITDQLEGMREVQSSIESDATLLHQEINGLREQLDVRRWIGAEAVKRLHQATLRLAQDRPEEAMRELEVINIEDLRGFGLVNECLYVRAICAFDLRRWQEAQRWLLRLLEVEPSADEKVQAMLGICYLRLNDTTRAEHIYRRLDSPIGYSMLGVIDYQRGNRHGALEYFRQAYERRGTYSRPWLLANTQAIILFELERFSEAESLARAALQDRPDYAEASQVLGMSLMLQDRIEEGIASLRTAEDGGFVRAKSRRNLIVGMIKLDRMEEARVLADDTLRRFPEQADAFRAAADVSFVDKDYLESAQRYVRAHEIVADPEVAFCAGSALDFGGELEEARRWLDVALDARPSLRELFLNNPSEHFPNNWREARLQLESILGIR